jgi:hypothetical protein
MTIVLLDHTIMQSKTKSYVWQIINQISWFWFLGISLPRIQDMASQSRSFWDTPQLLKDDVLLAHDRLRATPPPSSYLWENTKKHFYRNNISLRSILQSVTGIIMIKTTKLPRRIFWRNFFEDWITVNNCCVW